MANRYITAYHILTRIMRHRASKSRITIVRHVTVVRRHPQSIYHEINARVAGTKHELMISKHLNYIET